MDRSVQACTGWTEWSSPAVHRAISAEPRTDRGRQSRDRIVAVADALVAERGVEGASLGQILEAADASKSQLYHYFSGKDDLVRAVIARRRGQVLETDMPLLSTLDSWSAIRRWFGMAVQRMEAQGFRVGCPIGSLANELADRDEEARRDLVECFETWRGYLVEGLERMRARGELVERSDPNELATAVFACLQGGLLLAKTRKESGPLWIALDAALTYLRSFAPDRPERSESSNPRPGPRRAATQEDLVRDR